MPLFTHLRIIVGSSIPIYIPDLILFVLLIFIFNFIYFNSSILTSNTFLLFPILFLALGLTSFLNSIRLNNPLIESIYVFIRIALSITPFACAYILFIISHKSVMRLLIILSISTSLMSLLSIGLIQKWSFAVSIAEFLAPHYPPLNAALTLTNLGYYRASWGLGSATATAGLLLASLIISFSTVGNRNQSNSFSTLIYATIVICLIGLAFTFSRHAWFAFLISFHFMLFFTDTNIHSYFFSRKRIFITLLTAVLFIITPAAFYINKISRSFSIHSIEISTRLGLHGESINISDDTRLHSLINSFSAIADDFLTALLGAGPGHSLLSVHLQDSLAGGALYGHNFISSFILNWGILAAAIFLLSLIYTIYKSIIILKTKLTYGSEFIVVHSSIWFFIAFMFIIPFDHYFASLPSMSSLLWLNFGILSAATSKYNNKHTYCFY